MNENLVFYKGFQIGKTVSLSFSELKLKMQCDLEKFHIEYLKQHFNLKNKEK